MNVFVIGYPKSGTIWLARLLADALNSPLQTLSGVNGLPTEGQDRPGPYTIRHGHARPAQFFARFYRAGDKVVYIYRDPRDVIISQMFYWGLPSVHAAIKRVLATNTAGRGLVNHIRLWSLHTVEKVVTSYEDLHVDTIGELERILMALALPPIQSVSEVVERQSFARRRQYAAQHGDQMGLGKQQQLLYLRKGIVGDWRNFFTTQDSLLVQQRLGDLLVELGYTQPGEQWWVQ